MKYNKDPYHKNVELLNKTKNKESIIEDSFDDIKNALVKEGVKSVYEFGFEFGQRLEYLEKDGFEIEGGMEFDSSFSLYKKHANLREKNWDLRYINVQYWPKDLKIEADAIFCYKLLTYVEKWQETLENLKSLGKPIFLIEDIELDLPKKDGVYFYKPAKPVVKKKEKDETSSNSKSTKQSSELRNNPDSEQ